MNMTLQHKEPGSQLSQEIIDLMNSPADDFYEPDLVIGDSVNVFNHEEIVSMTIEKIDGKQFTLTDRCGFMFLAEIWRWSEQFGDVLRTKTSMRNARKAGWKNTCCDECTRYAVMQEQNQNLEEQEQ